MYQPGRRRLEMLRRWKKKFGREATYRKLITALGRVKRQDLVDKVIGFLDQPQTYNQSALSNSTPHSQPHTNVAGTAQDQPTAVPPTRAQGHPTPVQPAMALDQPTPSAIQSYSVYLKRRYQRQVPTFSTQWPPPSTKKVFNLAMISKKKVERRALADDEFVQLTIHGCVDDILELKTPVKLEDIFSRDEASRKVILIEGAPGSGKTTLAWHICQKWESGELFQEFNLVVLVQLRDPDIQTAQSISDLLPCSSMSRLQSVCTEIEENEGRGVLWVLDGWDELPPPLQKSSLFHELISPPRVSSLTGSAVLVTSRPISSADLHPLVSSRVEVIGFTEAQIKEYFTESLEHDPQTVEKLERHLSRNPVIESSCYLPLNAAIIVHLFLALGCTLPSSLHTTFCLMVVNCVFRYLKDRANRGSEIPPLSSLDHSSDMRQCFPPDIQTHFKNICHLAYVGIHENKLAFFASDLQQYGFSAPLCSLGLLREVESFVSVGKSVSYNFLHLSVQELLAAFHIFEMSPEAQIETFQSFIGHQRFASVLQFYAGITNLQTPGIQSVIASVVEGLHTESLEVLLRNRLHMVSVIRCLHESQDVQLCLSVAEMLQWKLDLGYTTLGHTDFLSIGYFSACVCYATDSQHEFILNLSRCSLGHIDVQYLMRGIMSADRSTLTSSTSVESGQLDMRLMMILSKGDPSAIYSIAEVLKSCNLVSKLFLMGGVGESGLRRIAEVLVSNSSLVKLDVSTCYIPVTGHSGPAVTAMLQRNKSLQKLSFKHVVHLSDSGALYIAEGLKQNAALRELSLGTCRITSVGAKAVAQALPANTSLQVLDLSNDAGFMPGISDQGAEELAKMLVVNRSLETLNLRMNEIHDNGAGLLADALKENTSLKVLNLGYNEIQDKGMGLLADALKVNRSLQHLDVEHNRISDMGAVEQAKMLVVNRSLETLNLRMNKIHDNGAGLLADALKENMSLKVLQLHNNEIQDNGAELLANALKVNTSLKVLNLKYNKIQDKGIGLLADALKVNRSLQHLDVGHNWISDKGVGDLAEMLLVNDTLQDLGLGGSVIQGPGLMKLGTCLKNNRTLSALNLWCFNTSPAFHPNLKQFVLSLADNCSLRELCLNYEYCSVLSEEVKVVNTTRRQRGHPELKLIIDPNQMFF